MREVKILPNWTDLLQHSSQSGALENINLKDTWFTTDIEKYPRETPTHMPRVSPKNNGNMITSLHPVQKCQEITVSKGSPVSEAIKCPLSDGVRKK